MVKMSDVWDRATGFVGDRLGAVLPFALLGLLLPNALSGAAQGWAATAGPSAQAVVSVGGIVLVLVTLWATAAITALAIDPDGRGAGALAARRVLPLLGVSIVLVLAMTLLLIPALVIVLGSGIDVNAFATMTPGAMPNLPAGAAIGLGVYVLVLFAVLLWVFARLIVITPVIVGERRGIGAIGHAWRLTRGHALKIVGVILLYAIVTVIATGAVAAGGGAILELTLGTPGSFSAATVATAVLVAILSTVVSLFQTVFVAKLYVALAPQRELAADFA